MIVFVSAVDPAEARAVGRALCRRYAHAALIDLEGLTIVYRSPERVDDALDRLVALHHTDGREPADVVLSCSFATVAELARVRRGLSTHDDVTYAFRLVRRDDPARLEVEADRGDLGYPIAADGEWPATLADAIWDNIHEQVALVDADPGWGAAYEQERAAVARALGPRCAGVHHIGSTAVAELPAKPVIDIIVSVRDLAADGPACIGPLRALGYHFADYPQNTDRLFFRKGFPRTHHLHVVAADSASLADHLAFCDALRADAALRAEYAALKRQLADTLGTDRAAYGTAKTALITRALGHTPR